MMKNVDFFRRFLVQCYDINEKIIPERPKTGNK